MGFLRTRSGLPASPATSKASGRPTEATRWVDEEIDQGAFKDARLGKRFRELLTRMGGGIGASIPLTCQDWANTKAGARFFANGRVSAGDILTGHFAATSTRLNRAPGTEPRLRDTSESR